jgi:hypothetical protein
MAVLLVPEQPIMVVVAEVLELLALVEQQVQVMVVMD